MTYRVFISHSASDQLVVSRVYEACRQVGVEPYVYEHDHQPGRVLATKVQEQIAASDAMIVLLSRLSSVSAYVQQEVGYALAHPKPILPLVEVGVVEDALAMLKGVEWEAFDPEAPDQAINAITKEIERLHLSKQFNQELVTAAALVAFLLLALYLTSRSA